MLIYFWGPSMTRGHDNPGCECAHQPPTPTVPSTFHHKVQFLDGVKDSVHNPHGNPNPYDGYIAVRSKRRQLDLGHRDAYRDMFKSTSEVHQDLFQYPIPDPTHMAREPYWREDTRPDIASNEHELQERWGSSGTGLQQSGFDTSVAPFTIGPSH